MFRTVFQTKSVLPSFIKYRLSYFQKKNNICIQIQMPMWRGVYRTNQSEVGNALFIKNTFTNIGSGYLTPKQREKSIEVFVIKSYVFDLFSYNLRTILNAQFKIESKSTFTILGKDSLHQTKVKCRYKNKSKMPSLYLNMTTHNKCSIVSTHACTHRVTDWPILSKTLTIFEWFHSLFTSPCWSVSALLISAS